MPKPIELPRFAELDQLSPVSTNNVIEPPESYKKYGHNFREKYKRNFFNWLHRLTYEWLKWYNDNTIRGSIDVIFHPQEWPTRKFTTATGGTLNPAGYIETTMHWTRVNDIVSITFQPGPDFIGGNLDGALSNPYFDIAPDPTPQYWPAAWIQDNPSSRPFHVIPVVCDAVGVPGRLRIPAILSSTTISPFKISASEPQTQGDNNDLISGVFGNLGGTDNGFNPSLWQFMVKSL